jgi:hypothetical protein
VLILDDRLHFLKREHAALSLTGDHSSGLMWLDS